MAGKLQVSVDQVVCVGNAMCHHVAPNVFTLNDRRQSQVVDPDGDSRETIMDAAEACPVNAVTVVDAETREQLFP